MKKEITYPHVEHDPKEGVTAHINQRVKLPGKFTSEVYARKAIDAYMNRPKLTKSKE